MLCNFKISSASALTAGISIRAGNVLIIYFVIASVSPFIMWNLSLTWVIPGCDLSAAFAYNCAPSLEITSILGYFDNHSFTSLVFRVGIKSIIL